MLCVFTCIRIAKIRIIASAVTKYVGTTLLGRIVLPLLADEDEEAGDPRAAHEAGPPRSIQQQASAGLY